MKILVFLPLFFSFSSVFGQSLRFFVEEGLKNNLEIQEFEITHDISSEKVNESSTLPNTNIGLGYFVSEPETRTGAQKTSLSVQQMFPWFGSISANKSYMNSLAEESKQDIVTAKKALTMGLSQEYYGLCAIKEKEKILVATMNLLETYETLLLSSISTGKKGGISVLRLQIRKNELEKEKSILEQMFFSKQAKLNELPQSK